MNRFYSIYMDSPHRENDASAEFDMVRFPIGFPHLVEGVGRRGISVYSIRIRNSNGRLTTFLQKWTNLEVALKRLECVRFEMMEGWSLMMPEDRNEAEDQQKIFNDEQAYRMLNSANMRHRT